MGTLSWGLILSPQAGQRDAGHTTDRLRGTRWITTFKKLPPTSPSGPTATTITRPPPGTPASIFLPLDARYSTRLQVSGFTKGKRWAAKQVNRHAHGLAAVIPLGVPAKGELTWSLKPVT